MRKNKIFLALLPIVTMLTFPSCNKQCVITLKSGAGLFATGITEMSLTVRPGTKLSQLAVGMPISFFYESDKSLEDVMYPFGWANQKGEIHRDYVFSGNTTLEARYFPSQELAINTVENKLNYALQDLLARVAEQTYQLQAIATYQDIIAGLKTCISEVQTTSFLIGSQGDIGALMRVMLNSRDSQISVLQQCRDIFIPLCLQINNPMSVVTGKSFAALFDAMGEVYDSQEVVHVEWFNHFMGKLTNTLLNAPTYTFQGAGIFEQAAIAAAKRIMINSKLEALAPMNRLYDLYHASFFECRTGMQATAIGKMGAAIADAAGENYPKGYDTFYELSKKEINEILHWGA